MSLAKALGWSSVNAGIRMILGFFSAKASAVYLGPSGMVLVGQLNSFMQVTSGAIANGANTAVVNLTAERRDSSQRLEELWGTAMRMVLGLAALIALVVIAGARPLSAWLLFSPEYWPITVAAGVVLALAVADNVVLGALNGLKQLNLIAKGSVISTLLEFALFVSLTYGFGVWGALAAMTCIYVTRLTISCTLAFRSGLIRPAALFRRSSRASTRDIARFYPMLLAHSIALPLAQILVRNLTVGAVGLEQGGYLQAAWRLSDVYVTVLTMALGMYFMAQFSAIDDEAERGAMLRRTILQVAAVTAAGAACIYLLRGFVVSVVLTRAFLPMTALLPFQLLGDVFKMADYPLQMALVSRRRVFAYIAQAVGGQGLYVALTYFWLPSLGVAAVPRAYAVSYLVVFVSLAFAWRSTLAARSPQLAVAGSNQLAV